MQTDKSRDDLLLLMLSDILREAEAIRRHDPIKASHLDDAANDLRLMLARRHRNFGENTRLIN